jgi:Flp pilus assembly protein CpaB
MAPPSRRVRAVGFLVASLLCAGIAAALAGGYGASVANQLGELRPVLVATAQLAAREPITARLAERTLEVRRVPERFAPAAALTAPAEAVGREPAVTISPGAYVTADQLRLPNAGNERREPALPRRLSPVEIEVSGAGALAASDTGSGNTKVDVVVTTEPGPGGERGSTYVAAGGVPLLGLTESADSGVEAATLTTHIATLALTRAQALRLIDAESFARQVRLIPAGHQ